MGQYGLLTADEAYWLQTIRFNSDTSIIGLSKQKPSQILSNIQKSQNIKKSYVDSDSENDSESEIDDDDTEFHATFVYLINCV